MRGRHAGKDIAAVQRNPTREAVLAHIDLCDCQCVRGAVDGVDPGFWKSMGEQDGEAARAGAHVGHACDGGRLFEPAVELRDYLKEVAAWNDGTLVDVEPVPAEKCLMREVGRRYAVHDAPAQHLLQRGAFRPGHATGEHGGPAVERKMQRAKQKIERLVMGGSGDLTDGDLVLRVEPFRLRQPAAQRARTIRGIGGNISVGGLLHAGTNPDSLWRRDAIVALSRYVRDDGVASPNITCTNEWSRIRTVSSALRPRARARG
jgi:hypothetical protein